MTAQLNDLLKQEKEVQEKEKELEKRDQVTFQFFIGDMKDEIFLFF